MLTKPAYTFSALQAVLMAASAGSFSNLVDDHFILDRRIKGGVQSVSVRVADELGPYVVFLDNPVRFLHWEDNGTAGAVRAVGDRPTVNARHAIVAIPPNLYSRISYLPSLPRAQQVAHQHNSMGLVIKVHATYPTPFWREAGLSGTGFAAGQVVQEVYDNTNFGEGRGTLVAFVSDVNAEAVFALDEEERKRTLLTAIARFLGPKALDPEVFYLTSVPRSGLEAPMPPVTTWVGCIAGGRCRM